MFYAQSTGEKKKKKKERKKERKKGRKKERKKRKTKERRVNNNMHSRLRRSKPLSANKYLYLLFLCRLCSVRNAHLNKASLPTYVRQSPLSDTEKKFNLADMSGLPEALLRRQDKRRTGNGSQALNARGHHHHICCESGT